MILRKTSSARAIGISNFVLGNRHPAIATEQRHRSSRLSLRTDATGAIAAVGRDAHIESIGYVEVAVKIMAEPSGVEPEFASLPPYQCGR